MNNQDWFTIYSHIFSLLSFVSIGFYLCCQGNVLTHFLSGPFHPLGNSQDFYKIFGLENYGHGSKKPKELSLAQPHTS